MLRAARLWFLLHRLRRLQDDVDHYWGILTVRKVPPQEAQVWLGSIYDRQQRIEKLEREIIMITPPETLCRQAVRT